MGKGKEPELSESQRYLVKALAEQFRSVFAAGLEHQDQATLIKLLDHHPSIFRSRMHQCFVILSDEEGLRCIEMSFRGEPARESAVDLNEAQRKLVQEYAQKFETLLVVEFKLHKEHVFEKLLENPPALRSRLSQGLLLLADPVGVTRSRSANNH